MPRLKPATALIPIDRVQHRILLIRGQRVILAADLARLFGVPVRRLNEQVRRNASRFPDDFVFQLSGPESQAILKSQIATSSRSRWGGARRALPYAFTEHGVVMAANVLRSPQAVKASVFVVRAFVKLRELLSTHIQLAQKLDELERKLQNHDNQIISIIDAIRDLMDHGEADDPPKPPIGFHTELLPATKTPARHGNTRHAPSEISEI